MNRALFDLCVKTQLVTTLQPGDVIILDNLSSHKSPGAAAVMKGVGAWFLFRCSGKTPPPGVFSDPSNPYRPDLNPIEMAFAKLKALIRKAAARSDDAV